MFPRNQSFWCSRLQPSDGSTWSPPPPPPPPPTNTSGQTHLLIIKYQYSTEYYFDDDLRALGFSSSVSLGPNGYLTRDLDLFTRRPRAKRTVVDMLSETQLWSTIPSDSQSTLIEQIGGGVVIFTRPPRRPSNNNNTRYVRNIYLEVEIFLFNHIVDFEHELFMNGFFGAGQEHGIPRPAPPELLGSLVPEVCTGETNIEYQCVICMEEFIVGVKIQRLPCSHRFHEDCIFRWFRDKSTCPVCRFGEQL